MDLKIFKDTKAKAEAKAEEFEEGSNDWNYYMGLASILEGYIEDKEAGYDIDSEYLEKVIELLNGSIEDH